MCGSILIGRSSLRLTPNGNDPHGPHCNPAPRPFRTFCKRSLAQCAKIRGFAGFLRPNPVSAICACHPPRQMRRHQSPRPANGLTFAKTLRHCGRNSCQRSQSAPNRSPVSAALRDPRRSAPSLQNCSPAGRQQAPDCSLKSCCDPRSKR